MHVLCKTVFADEAKTHQKRQNLTSMDKRTPDLLIAHESSRNWTFETLISRRLGLLTRNWPRRTSRCLCPLQQGRLYSLSLALRSSWSVYYSERHKKRRDSALNTTSSHNLRRGRTHSPPPLWDTTCFRWKDSIATLWNNPIHTSPSASPRPLLSCCWPQCPRCRCRRWNSYLQPGEPFCPEAEHWEQRRQQIRGTATRYQHETAP